MWLDVLIVVILALITIGIVLYIRKCKKRGQHCIGCPYGKSCGGNCANKIDGQ